MRYASQLIGVLAALALASYVGAQATVPSDAKIVVLPFTALNPSQEQAWLGRSIQQSVLADLTAAAPGRVVSADTEVTDMTAAAEIGKHANAAYVVHGSFTTLATSGGQGMRIMGEVVDSGSGRAVASFKATGMYSEIFRLEDQVASQIRQHMPGVLPPPVLVQNGPAPQSPPMVTQSEPATQSQQPLPQVNEYYSTYTVPQTTVPADAYYNYNYSTPYYAPYYPYYYGYGYPYGYVGLGWGTAFFFGSTYGHNHYDHGYYGGHGGGYYGGHGGGYYGGKPGGAYAGANPHVNSGIYNAGGGRMGGAQMGAAHMGGAGAAHGGGGGGHR